MSDWQQYLEDHRQALLAELIEFLSIPSISAFPEHADDVAAAGQWMADKLTRIGIEHAAVMPTGGHPIVYGDWLHAPGKPTYVIYGHFDTQPVDPLEQWKSPPFEPQLLEDRIVARGASDDKGNIFLAVAAVEALLATAGKLPVNVKFFFEGQEEVGSPQLPQFLAEHREMLACNAVLNADSGQFSLTQPAILLSLRGACGLEIDMIGPSHDLHSGTYGGAVQNPLHAMVRLLDSMRAPDGRIAIDGFYDDVVELSAEERAELARIPFDKAKYKADLEVEELFGEPGYEPWERTSIRPTLELNGMWGGFTGVGGKTVLPSEAHCKITCRLVPNQDPEKIVELIKKHIAANTPPGVKVKVSARRGAPAYVVPRDLPELETVRQVLTQVYGCEPFYLREGGSIPVTTLFEQILGASSIGYGFGLEDNMIHAPNEFLRLASIDRGMQCWATLLEAFGA